MTEEEALKIAKKAYLQINDAISDLEEKYPGLSCHWDECISIDEYFFTGRKLYD